MIRLAKHRRAVEVEHGFERVGNLLSSKLVKWIKARLGYPTLKVGCLKRTRLSHQSTRIFHLVIGIALSLDQADYVEETGRQSDLPVSSLC